MDKQTIISDLTEIYKALVDAGETIAAHHVAYAVHRLGGDAETNAPADANQPGSE